MFEIVGPSCWLVSTSKYMYFLACKLKVNLQLCITLHHFFFFLFSLKVLYNSYMQNQAPYLYNFIEVVRSCYRGLNYFGASQDTPLNPCGFCFL